MDFLNIFQNNYQGFSNFCESVLKPAFGADNFNRRDLPQAINGTEKDVIESINLLGDFELTDGDKLLCFDVTLTSSINLSINKVKIQQAVRKILPEFSSAIIIFHFPDNTGEWRISFVSKGENASDTTSAKRYTYLLGEHKHCRTVSERFNLLSNTQGVRSLKSIEAAFSVESLTKDFYTELYKWYEWAISDNGGFNPITYPNDTSTETDDRKIEEHIIRLITRLMFVWFIKQKDLVPQKLFDVDSLKQLLKNFDPTSKEQGNYYNAILQNLFFATLNKAIPDRAFANDSTNKADGKEHYGIKSLFRNPKGDSWFQVSNEEVVKEFSTVPFLNGGLFECLDKEVDARGKIMYFDGFSREAGRQRRAFIPNCLFFDPQKGIIPLLEKYNFTIEENTPTDVQVALDPELLGKVFENLLGAYNPETKETARKQSGSFYTPREIVNYMVDESLIAHLNTKCPCIGEDTVRQLFQQEPFSVDFDSTTRRTLIHELKTAKILDPACGSGAFPMGVLNRMVNLLQRLGDEEANTPYLQKLHLIENCIYGVDIQTIAVQISKLRFFISLVCEQTPNTSANDNYGITPLPNLETKFVAANTLIGLEKGFSNKLDLGYTEIRELKESLWKIRSRHFSAGNFAEKHELRKQDAKLRKEIQEELVSITTQPDPAKIDRLQKEIDALQAEKEQYKGECWVSLTTPEAKQMSMFDQPKKAEQQSLKIDKNKEERNRIEKLVKEKLKELEKETSKTNQPGFENEASLLAAWNPYDQNTSSPFFDPEWMFDAKDGFDVVIGNPPYIQLQKITETATILKREKFETFEKTGDIYALFYEKGFQVLKNNGVHTFITSSQWMKTAYGKSLRKYFLKQNPLKLVLLGPGAFENAIVDTNILIAQKGEYRQALKGLIIDSNSKLLSHNSYMHMPYISENTWAIIDPFKQTIKSKIERNGKQLKDWNIEIYRGVLTGYNEAFIINQVKRDELVAKDPKLVEIIKPILRGRGVEKYVTVWDGDYINFIPWHFPMHNDSNITGASLLAEQQFKLKHSTLYNYFLEHKDGLLKRNQEETGVRYEWYALQRCAATYKDEFKKEKIVWKRIGSQLRFSYTDEEIFCLDSTCIATGEKIKYLTALLNSKLCNYQLFENAPRTGMGDLIISVQALEPLLVYYPNDKEEKQIVSLVDSILTAKKADPQADTLPWEAEIDARVFHLYGLAESEMEVVLNSLPSVNEKERVVIVEKYKALQEA